MGPNIAVGPSIDLFTLASGIAIGASGIRQSDTGAVAMVDNR